MSNSTYIQKISLSVRLLLVLPSVIFLCAFLYLTTTIIRVYWNMHHIRETPRYILFFHMLIYDTLFLLLGFLLLMASEFSLTMLISICYVLVMIGELTYMITPFILAAMSMERYISVCFPLRHAELCTTKRSNATVAALWVVALTLKAIDFPFLAKYAKSDFFVQYVVCQRKLLSVNPLQELLAFLRAMFSLALVGLIIIYTYISILVVALKIGSGKSSGLKASKTVLLHAFQLLLYITSFLSPLAKEPLSKMMSGAEFLEFLLFICFPRFLGPLLYGLRDETLRKCIQRTLGIGRFNKKF